MIIASVGIYKMLNNLRVIPGLKYNWDLKSHVIGGNCTGKKLNL